MILYLVCNAIISFDIRRYFRSTSFVALSAKSDDVVEQYDKLTIIIKNFKNHTYADFSPTIDQQIAMLNGNMNALEMSKALPHHTYFCTSQILANAKENAISAVEGLLKPWIDSLGGTYKVVIK